MKKHWLRGSLLGVSMALLLSGGVALAGSVHVRVDQPCFECVSWDERAIPEDKMVELTLSGYDPGEDLYVRLTMAGELWGEGYFRSPLTGPPCGVQLVVRCEDLAVGHHYACQANALGTGFNAEVDPPTPFALYGEWIWRIEQNGEADQVSFLFAEDCAAAMFVPEAGSILLLGGGLAGLAGYATVRWRTRE